MLVHAAKKICEKMSVGDEWRRWRKVWSLFVENDENEMYADYVAHSGMNINWDREPRASTTTREMRKKTTFLISIDT